MRKFFQLAVMALAVGFFSSCGMGGSSSYKQGDAAPKIDADNCTVNGIRYDNQTERCWKVTSTVKVSVLGIEAQAKDNVVYVWETQFALVAEMEMAMWTAAQAGSAASASYSYTATTDKDSESCLNRNTK